MVSPLLAVAGAHRGGVGDRQHGPVDHGQQQAPPPYGLCGGGGRGTAQQVEQRAQGCGTQPLPGLPQRAGGRLSHGQSGQAGGQLLPHLRVAEFGEQAAGQHQVHHHPGR